MDSDRPPSLTFPLAVTVSFVTVGCTLSGIVLALEVNEGIWAPLALLGGWTGGHCTAAFLASISLRDHGRLAVAWTLLSMVMLAVPVALAAAFFAWLSQQQLWTIF